MGYWCIGIVVLRRASVALAAATFLVGWVDCHAQGTWQSAPCLPSQASSEQLPSSRFLVLDTGGSGGGFGQGDVRQKLHDVFFWNEKLGWTSGYGGVFHTEDGGLTWTRMKPAGGWYQIEMTGPEDIWLLEGKHPGGMGNAWLWHSVDGGKTWEEQLKGKIGHYWDMYCRGQERWVLCAGFPSYHSNDGGISWNQVNLQGMLQVVLKVAIPADVPTPEGFVVYVFGFHQQRARLVKSVDGGHSWTVVALPEEAPAYVYARLHFATSRMGWIGLSEGKILFTANGGDSWEWRNLPSDRAVSALWFDQLGRGFAAVQNTDFFRFREALFETRDGGRSWVPVLAGAKHVSALFGLGPGRLWAVGDVPGFVPNDLVVVQQFREVREE